MCRSLLGGGGEAAYEMGWSLMERFSTRSLLGPSTTTGMGLTSFLEKVAGRLRCEARSCPSVT